ncbi:SDR family NAD(P)-dependent oxidoreductase [Streptomyces shenzhenensis]|uniref:SDR family NAD(P)-dependent oxidoreductase n=1 Tax=Streptomyces shenzhenensis TaxID=943815 RepID=UPI0038058916
MPGRLSGKVCLITGAARGLGASHATLFAQEGARLILADVLDDEGTRLADRITAEGGQAHYVHLDVRSADDWATAVQAATDHFDGLDVLVNNAGVDSPPSLMEETEEHYRHVVDINQVGVFLGMRAATPALEGRGGGSIVNISSVSGIGGSPGFIAYHASKAEVRLMSRGAAVALGSLGIRVNSVCPGIVPTPAVLAHKSVEDLATDPWVVNTPLRRAGTPIEVSYGVLYLASPESSWVTGTDLVIDGGYLAQ